MLVVGSTLTLAAALTAQRLTDANEHRLLAVQTRQASAIVSAAVIALQAPLTTAAAIGAATQGNPQAFQSFIATYIGPSSLFVTATLWRLDTAGHATAVAAAGIAPALDPTSPTAQQLRLKAEHSLTFVVQSVSSDSVKRIAFGIASKTDPRYVVLAERAIPANRRVPVESGSAFSDLHFATYLGRSTATADLQTTDMSLAQLPLRGDTSSDTIPFGDTSITLMTSPAGHLGGSLGVELPWILLVVGLTLTLAAAALSGQLARRKARAETDAHTITELYQRLDARFDEQRSISETLQRALLPQGNPDIPDLEIASRYVAGAKGVDVGGDWYSMISLDDRQYAFVVGDVSGRGVDAAALMGRIRFTLRAYLVEGHPPEVALSLCSRQVSMNQDGHIATVLVGVGDVRSGHLRLANAGHLPPLLCTDTDTAFVQTIVGVPLGVRPTRYDAVDLHLQPGATLIAYTDGLVERRHELLSDSLQRLARTVSRAGPLESRLDALLKDQSNDDTDDDIAILAFRRSPNPTDQQSDNASASRILKEETRASASNGTIRGGPYSPRQSGSDDVTRTSRAERATPEAQTSLRVRATPCALDLRPSITVKSKRGRHLNIARTLVRRLGSRWSGALFSTFVHSP